MNRYIEINKENITTLLNIIENIENEIISCSTLIALLEERPENRIAFIILNLFMLIEFITVYISLKINYVRHTCTILVIILSVNSGDV